MTGGESLREEPADCLVSCQLSNQKQRENKLYFILLSPFPDILKCDLWPSRDFDVQCGFHAASICLTSATGGQSVSERATRGEQNPAGGKKHRAVIVRSVERTEGARDSAEECSCGARVRYKWNDDEMCGRA